MFITFAVIIKLMFDNQNKINYIGIPYCYCNKR